MSVGHPHKRPNETHPVELKQLMASPSFQRLWARPFRVDLTKQIPDTAGYNVLGTAYYLDRDFVAAVQSGQIKIPGMTPQEILIAVLTHERIEKCLLDADNNIDLYPEAHEFATTAEHEYVRSTGQQRVAA